MGRRQSLRLVAERLDDEGRDEASDDEPTPPKAKPTEASDDDQPTALGEAPAATASP